MPNTAIAIQESMTCISAHNASEQQIQYVSELFGNLGKVVFIEEKLMDAATVLAACGTAYAMRFIRANIQRNTHPEQEIDKVTTPKGCTIAGLNEMEHQGFSSSLIKGIVTSYKKIVNDM
jgi:pyrroline-5-carboxylate reductase